MEMKLNESLATQNGIAIRKGITRIIETNRTTAYKHNCLSYESRD